MLNQRFVARAICVASLLGLAASLQAATTVGLATGMHKIMIRGQHEGFPFQGWTADHYDLSLARNEHEAFQVVVIPDQNLTGATVSVSTPQGTAGQGALNGTVKVWLVGHVDAADNPLSDLNVDYPTYLDTYTGWWPDPLLTFQQSCSINSGDRVSFWIDVASKANTPAGDYVATVTVDSDQTSPTTLQLNLHVWDFELPVEPSLPTAFSCHTWMANSVYGGSYDSGVFQGQVWDMQQDHRLSPNELYRKAALPLNWMQDWMAGGASAFHFGKVPTDDWTGLNTLYNYFVGLNRLGQAYVYGYDEITPDKFQDMYNTFTEIHNRYPGLRTMTTAYDMSFGTSSSTSFLRSAVDIWVPWTPSYSMTAAESLRAEGKDMWWYVAVGPRHPYANFLLEYPAIESRLLLGAMTYKYQASGFLYYSMLNWINLEYNITNSPITSGPYTNWDPRTIYHESKQGWADSDGCLYYPGPAAVGPMPCIRLENIRDGLEDYEYLHRLAELVALVGRCPDSPAEQTFLDEARALLAVPDSVVTSVATYSRDPQVLSDYRQQLADKIIEGQSLAVGAPADTDGDGVGDPCDNCPSSSNPDQLDTDDDGQGNACDPDDDNDGVADGSDNCPLIDNSDQEDTDSDGVGDVCDNCPEESNAGQEDTDGDGLGDACDNCPQDANVGQEDGDGDHVGDVCDNCLDKANTDQVDSDEDGIGDACDDDPSGAKWIDEEFDGAMSGDDQTGSWNQTSMTTRWPVTFAGPAGTFTAGKGVMPSPGAAMNTNKGRFRMTADLEPDLSATYGTGNRGIGVGNKLNGTDAKPLIMEFWIDYNGEGFGAWSNFYMELSLDDGSGDDMAPQSGMITEDPDLGNGDQGPWTDQQNHRAIAFGSFAAVNIPYYDPDSGGTKGAPMYYDGYRWHYVKMMTDVEGNAVNLWKRQDGGPSIFRLTVRSSTVVLEVDNLEGWPENTMTYEVPREYTGSFNHLSMTMGNPLVTGKASYIDQIEIRYGEIEVINPTGACCVQTGPGAGTCVVTDPQDCEENLGGTYLGDLTLCGTNNSNCDFCGPQYGDMDSDGDVDLEDFGVFQACFTGWGTFTLSEACTCLDGNTDSAIDIDDFNLFQGCLSGADILADPECASAP